MRKNLYLKAKTEVNLKQPLKTKAFWKVKYLWRYKELGEKWTLSMKTSSNFHLKTFKSHSLLVEFMQNI